MWLFGDGGSSRKQNPAHTYATPGQYDVSLTVTTVKGKDTKQERNLIIVTTPSEAREETIMLPGNVPLAMVWIPAGTFTMGSPDAEQDRWADEGPQRQVTLSRGFWIGKHEVTKRQWQAVTGTTPWAGHSCVLDDLDSPAVYISWNSAKSFIAILNDDTAMTFRLPTEAEWEYACRARTATRFYWDDDPTYTLIGDYAFYWGNCFDKQYAHAVGLKPPNAWSLCDMSGNVWEYVQDWYGDYPSGAVSDPKGPASGSYRVSRGGGWNNVGYACRSAYRGLSDPSHTTYSLGFRLAM
jgi:formylglycine-generating enzyme required for sulfatase activity